MAIGSFQAVKHHLADAALALEFARPAVLPRRLVGGPRRAHPGPRRVDGQGHGLRRRRLVGRKALQCHGAIGYTVEDDLHL